MQRDAPGLEEGPVHSILYTPGLLLPSSHASHPLADNIATGVSLVELAGALAGSVLLEGGGTGRTPSAHTPSPSPQAEALIRPPGQAMGLILGLRVDVALLKSQLCSSLG